MKVNFFESRERPYVYALSLGVYCTSWTFFGSVGYAARSGFDFIAVYLGPILAFTLAVPLLRRVIKLTKAQNITSTSDFIGARYGKNPYVSAVVTIIAICALIPYIALQLKAVSEAISLVVGHPLANVTLPGLAIKCRVDFLIPLVLALFSILFGARKASVTEHQRGLMLAIAVESVVKIVAFAVAGYFIVFVMFGSVHMIVERVNHIPAVNDLFGSGLHGGDLLTITFLSFVCTFLLPRQFHVAFVENVSERELQKATYIFPIYLIFINIFVVPVAIAGLLIFAESSVNKDMYLLALPLQAGSWAFTLIAFIGGISAATAMVIVETVSLSVMICNDLFMPVLLKQRLSSKVEASNMLSVLLNIRRASILGLLLLAYAFYTTIDRSPLAKIGLMSFVAVAQFAPAFFGGLIWRRATARGAIAGILAGFTVWVYTLVIPYLANLGIVNSSLLENGLFGLQLLRPQMLFYLNFEPLTHSVVWSMCFNVFAFMTVSLLRPPEPIERLQANIFIEDEPQNYVTPKFKPWHAAVTMDDLINTVSRYLGDERTLRSFQDYSINRGVSLNKNAEADIHTIRFTENLLASAIGAASSRLVMSLTIRRQNVGAGSALKLLDDASEAIQYNRDFLQTAIDHVSQGLAVFDRNMRLICWNRQFREILLVPISLARFGVSLDQILRHVAQNICIDNTTIDTFTLDRIKRHAVTMEAFQERLIDGRVLEVRTDAMPQGGIAVTYMDITDQVAVADALEKSKETLERRVESRTAELTLVNEELKTARSIADEANLGKTRFLAAASHDILQPLNAARLYTATLIERAPSIEFDRITRNVDASLEAVEDILKALLDISQLDTGGMRPDITTFPISDIFDQIRIDFEPMAKNHGLRFTIVPSTAFVRSDRKLLRRVVQNLVSNAIKYTRSGGVVLGARKRSGFLEIQIHDTGPGIPEHKRNVIFQEFKRLEQKGSNIPGLGLGLSIVQRMCHVLDHPINFTSKIGQGTSFSVSAPAARWSEIEKPRPLGLRHGGYGDFTGSIVICLDDEKDILDSMQTLLSGWQCLVLTATDSQSAISQLSSTQLRPDIILSDYHLAKMTGLHAIQSIFDFCKCQTPAIIISADHTNSLRQSVNNRGFSMLNKPVKPAALRALMAQMMLRQYIVE